MFVDTAITVRVAPSREVDLLFMIDGTVNVGRVSELSAELPEMFRELSSGEARGESHPPVDSIRVGVITQDMGTGPAGPCSVSGDDGYLQTRGNTADPSCMATYPAWLEFAGDSDALGNDGGCILSAIGTSGCGFEQPLESILKAITPSTSPLRFARETVGHGDGVNAGFLREDSLLVVVALTDEDDCSAADLGIFDPDDPRFIDNLNLRCSEHPEALHPVERYVQGLLASRDGRPGRLLYALFGGVPPDLTLDPSLPLEAQIEALLADERMQSRPHELDSTQLTPSCDRMGFSRAFPPERLVETALGLSRESAHVWVDTICDDMVGPVDRLVAKIFEALGPACLARGLRRGPDGRVPCELVELTASECGPGQVDDGTGDGLRRCILPQLAVVEGTLESGDGWYYDDFSAEAERCFDAPRQIAYTAAAEPEGGTAVALECQRADAPREVGVGTLCVDDPSICDEATDAVLEAFPGGLACDTVNTRTCQARCNRESDCGGDKVCGDFGFCFCAP